MAKSVYKEKDGMEIELGKARRIKLWRTETELQTEADEGALLSITLLLVKF